MTLNHSSRRWLGYSVAALLMLSLITTVGVLTAASQPTNPCVGTLTSPANGTTVISVQGMKFAGEDSGKKPARLIGVGPTGEIEWVYKSGKKQNIVWSHDVDPLENGNLFVTATKQRSTVFYEFDPRTQERLWTEKLDLIDPHDADLLSGERLHGSGIDTTTSGFDSMIPWVRPQGKALQIRDPVSGYTYSFNDYDFVAPNITTGTNLVFNDLYANIKHTDTGKFEFIQSGTTVYSFNGNRTRFHQSSQHDLKHVRNVTSPENGRMAYHDPSISGDTNTEGPAFYNGSSWISQVDGSTIS